MKNAIESEIHQSELYENQIPCSWEKYSEYEEIQSNDGTFSKLTPRLGAFEISHEGNVNMNSYYFQKEF